MRKLIHCASSQKRDTKPRFRGKILTFATGTLLLQALCLKDEHHTEVLWAKFCIWCFSQFPGTRSKATLWKCIIVISFLFLVPERRATPDTIPSCDAHFQTKKNHEKRLPVAKVRIFLLRRGFVSFFRLESVFSSMTLHVKKIISLWKMKIFPRNVLFTRYEKQNSNFPLLTFFPKHLILMGLYLVPPHPPTNTHFLLFVFTCYDKVFLSWEKRTLSVKMFFLKGFEHTLLCAPKFNVPNLMSPKFSGSTVAAFFPEKPFFTFSRVFIASFVIFISKLNVLWSTILTMFSTFHTLWLRHRNFYTDYNRKSVMIHTTSLFFFEHFNYSLFCLLKCMSLQKRKVSNSYFRHGCLKAWSGDIASCKRPC